MYCIAVGASSAESTIARYETWQEASRRLRSAEISMDEGRLSCTLRQAMWLVQGERACRQGIMSLVLDTLHHYRSSVQTSLVEGRGTRGREDAPALDDSVRKREAKFGNQELLDVRTANVGRLLDFGNAKDL